MPNEDYGTNSSQYNPTSGMAMYSGKTESSDLLGGENGYRPSGGEWSQLYKDLSDSQARYWEQKARDGEPGAQWQAGASQNIAKNWGSIASNPAQANSMRWAQGGFQPLIDRLQNENQDVQISPEMARYLSKNRAGAKPLPTGDLGGGNGTLTQQTSLFGSFGGPVSGGAPDTTPQADSFNHNSGYAGSGSPWTDAQMGRGSGTPFNNSQVGADPGRGMVDWNVGPMPGQVPIDRQRLLEQHRNAILGMTGGDASGIPPAQPGEIMTDIGPVPNLAGRSPGGVAQQQGSAFQAKAPEAFQPPSQNVPQPQLQSPQPDEYYQPDPNINPETGQPKNALTSGLNINPQTGRPFQQLDPQTGQLMFKNSESVGKHGGVDKVFQPGTGPATDAEGEAYAQRLLKASPEELKQFAPQGDLSVVGMQPLTGGHYQMTPTPLTAQERPQFQQWAKSGNHPVTMRKDPLRHGTPFDDELFSKQKSHRLYRSGSNTQINNRSTPFDDELYDRSGGKKFTKANHESLMRSNPPQNPIEAGQDDAELNKHAKIKAYMGKNPHIEKYLLSLA